MHFQRGFNVSKALPQFYVVVKDCKIVILTLYKRLAGIFKFILVSVLAGTETFSVGESYGRGFRLFWRRFQKAILKLFDNRLATIRYRKNAKQRTICIPFQKVYSMLLINISIMIS